MKHFIAIISMPDNIPVIGMVIALLIVMKVWMNEVSKHDKLIKDGEKKDIYKEMIM